MASLDDMDFNVIKTLGDHGVEKGKWEQVAKTEKRWKSSSPWATMATQQKR